MLNEGDSPRGDEKMYEDRYAEGFTEGFSRARAIFWRDFMRKAGEAHLMGELLVGTPAEDVEEAKKFALMEVVYKSVAETIARSHTLYPGAVKDEAGAEGRGATTINYDDLFKY